MPKIKIDQTELTHFTYESLVVDPYWNDLYINDKPEKSLNKKANH